MPLDELPEDARRDRVRLAALAILLAVAAALGVWYLQSTIPRRIVLASGVKDASYHIDAHRYAELLAREGVTVVERMTGGAGENAALLLDPKSGVDVAFMEGGVVAEDQRDKIVMLASIRYEPLWVFYRGDATLTRLDELRYKRLAVGRPGNGGRLIVEPLLQANNVTASNTRFLPLGGTGGVACVAVGQRRCGHFCWRDALADHLAGTVRRNAQAHESCRCGRLCAPVSLPHAADVAGRHDRSKLPPHSPATGRACRHEGDARRPRKPAVAARRSIARRGAQAAFDNKIISKRRGNSRQLRRWTFRFPSTRIGTFVSARASCIATCRSGSRPCSSGLSSSYCHCSSFSCH